MTDTRTRTSPADVLADPTGEPYPVVLMKLTFTDQPSPERAHNLDGRLPRLEAVLNEALLGNRNPVGVIVVTTFPTTTVLTRANLGFETPIEIDVIAEVSAPANLLTPSWRVRGPSSAVNLGGLNMVVHITATGDETIGVAVGAPHN